MHARAKFLHLDLSKFEDFFTGSNSIPFDNAMLTQCLLVVHSTRIRVVIDNNHSCSNTNPFQYDCSRNWPRTLYACHIIDREIFGVPFVMITGFNSKKRDKKLLWLTCTIICHCKEC